MELERERHRQGRLEGVGAEAMTTCAVALSEALPAWRKLPLTSIELAERAVETASVLGLQWRGFAEEALANARLEGGRVQDNIDQLEWVAEDYRLGKPDTWLRLWANLADSYRNAGRTNEAFELIERTRLNLGRVDIRAAARAQIELYLTGTEGMAYLDLGVVDQASRCFDEFAELAQGPLALRVHAATAYSYRAALLMATSRDAEACSLLDDALADASLAEFHGGFLATQGHRNSGFEKEGLQPAGIARVKLEAALAVPLGENKVLLVHLGLAELDLRRGTDLEAVALRLDQVEQQIERTFGTHGLDLRSRLVVLRARLGVALGEDDSQLEQRLAALDTVFADLLAEWDAAPRRSGGLGYLRYNARQAVLWELAALSLRLKGPEAGARAAVAYMMRARSRSSVVRSLGGEGPEFADLARGIDAVQTVQEQLLRPGQGALVYMPGNVGRSLVIAIDADSIEAIPLPPPWVWRRETKQLLQRLRLRLSLPGLGAAPGSGSGYDDLTRVLAESLLPPAVQERLARWTAVTIVGRDLAGDVPFEILPLEGRRALGLELAVDYLPSLFLGCVLARRAEPPAAADADGMRLTVVVAPDEGPESPFENIPWQNARADPWRASYGAGAVRVFAGPEADASALTRATTESSSVLHLLLHGDSEGTWEHAAALVLTPNEEHADGRLRAPDIERMSLPGLVVLSVCGAARGPERIGDSLAGNLSGSLLRAGANATVISSSDLEYGAALVMMDTFHDRLARGDSPAQAMRCARVALADHPTYADPVHWAVVNVMGLGQQPLFERHPAAAAHGGGEPGDSGSSIWNDWSGALAGAAVLALALIALLAGLRRIRT